MALGVECRTRRVESSVAYGAGASRRWPRALPSDDYGYDLEPAGVPDRANTTGGLADTRTDRAGRRHDGIPGLRPFRDLGDRIGRQTLDMLER